jgi:hypothetical protein
MEGVRVMLVPMGVATNRLRVDRAPPRGGMMWRAVPTVVPPATGAAGL